MAGTLCAGHAGAQTTGQKTEPRPAALEFTVAFLATLLLLVVACKPTRKA